MYKILTIVGARPQFIKAAVVSRAFNLYPNEFLEIIIHTGQHYDENMSDIFFKELQIPKPSYHLGIGGGSHGTNTGRMIESIEAVMVKEKPDFVLVYGDTDSTLAAALSAAKLHIPVAHVESGLRSFNKKMPEEINRILTDHISTLLLSPTETAIINLSNEGINNDSVHQVGDVMYDAALFYKHLAQSPKEVKIDRPFYLSTIHRAENTNNQEHLRSIILALQTLSIEIDVVLPLHPRTKEVLKKNNISTEGLKIIDPVGYLEMVWLLENCEMVLTDSGGLQKEAYFFQKQAVVLRTETEWVELLHSGWNILGGNQYKTILNSISKLKKSSPDSYKLLYGNGKSGEMIVSIILQYLVNQNIQYNK